ncbi:SH3 domain-containing protein [Shimia biformata]|uniref:SH3 domain-containing protein n=1 Tax=Shimia biformata TaxID=1294299 RepID=UPI00195205E5|nr:SH3 domain-containing protein [Shimia biformata]
MIRVLLALALLLPAPLLAQSYGQLPGLFRVTDVAPNDVLNIRAQPDASAPIVGVLPHDATAVEVVYTDDTTKWGRVNSGETGGWVSMRFLARESDRMWSAASTPLSCFGTEPFWNATVDFDPATLAFRWFDSPATELEITWVHQPAGRIGGPLGLKLTGVDMTGFATIREDMCNDGMSDRAFGLAVELFLEDGEGPQGYSGCCSLGH